MGSEVNAERLSQVRRFVLILEGSGWLVPGKLMVSPGRLEVKYVTHRDEPLCLFKLTLSLSLSLSYALSLSLSHTHTDTHTKTHTGTKKDQSSVIFLVYLDNFGMASNFKP